MWRRPAYLSIRLTLAYGAAPGIRILPRQLCTCRRCFLFALLPGGPRSQRLAIAELDHVAIRSTNAAVIAHRIRLLTRFPDQIPDRPRLVSDGVHRRAAVECKAQMAIVCSRLGPALPAWD